MPAQDTEAYDEARLVSRARTGDVEALGDLFVYHVGSVRRLLVSVIGPGAELDDLAQDIFLQVYRSLGHFRGDSGFATWLHRLTINTAISHIRKKKRNMTPIEPSLANSFGGVSKDSPHDSQVVKEMVRRLYAILDTISPKRRAAFVLFEIEGVNLVELAKILGVSRAAAKSRVWFARKEIRKKAAEDDYLRPLLMELKQL